MRTKLLTKKEQAELVAFREKIIERALSTEPIDHKKAETAYNNLLERMGYEKVDNFLWFDSPHVMHSQLRGQLRDQLWGQLGDQLGVQLRVQLRNQLGVQLDQRELQYYMCMEFVSELDGVKANKDKLEKLKLLSELEASAFWVMPLKNGAAFCERPTRLVMQNARLHYDHDAAIEFKDGWKLYYLNGVHFDEDTWRKIVEEKITLKNLGDIKNADQRAVAVQFLRPDRLLKQVNAKLINIGKKGTELYQVDNFMDTGETEYCMKMEHPSIKGKFYIEWVEPQIGKQSDADLAQATAFGVPKAVYLMAQEA